VFIRGNEVTVANSDGSNVRTLAVLPSPAYSMFWSPDSTMLAYMVADSRETLAGMECGNSAFNPPSHGLLRIALTSWTTKIARYLWLTFATQIQNQNSSPTKSTVSVAAFSPSPHARSLDCFAPSDSKN